MDSSLTHPTARPVLTVAGLLVALVMTVMLVLVPAWSANAHSAVIDSTPGEGETLTTLPDTFSITSNETLLDVTGEGSGFALQIIDAAGLHYEQSCPVVDGEELSTAAAIGEAGAYELRYQFVSADGHAVSGAIPFEWAPADAFEATAGTEVSACDGVPSETDVESTPPPGAVNDGGPGTTDPADAGLPTWAWILIIGGAVLVVVVVVIVVITRAARR